MRDDKRALSPNASDRQGDTEREKPAVDLSFACVDQSVRRYSYDEVMEKYRKAGIDIEVEIPDEDAE